MFKNSSYLSEVAVVAAKITPAILLDFCDALEKMPADFSARDSALITEPITQPDIRIAILQLLNPSKMYSCGMTPRDLAWALRAASFADEFHQKNESLELVWTGPATSSSTMRRTDQALLDLINESRNSILLVTFAAYKIPHVSDALSKAAARNVRITLILESSEESEGKLTFNAIKALGMKVAEQSTVFVWPHDKRPRDENGHFGSLHAKCAVIDSKKAFISSANLTDYALTLNMELGIVIHGGDLPSKIQRHFECLISEGILKKID